ncbi:MAG: aminotransferase class IV [Roseibacillus sp.]|mgnify:CR=1 FL=1|jgi:branched-chain amino acid aminotransferase
MADMVWLNGSLQLVSEAAISPFDHGITVGDGVFETMISYAGVPFAFTRHHQRLERSAAAMGLEVRPLEELRDASIELLKANELTDQLARIRITLTGGPAPLGSERGDSPHTTLIAATPTPDLGETVDVSVVPYTRNENGALSGLKTTSYGENVVALSFAKERGSGEAIFANTKGELCEGTGSNIFIVSDGQLVTPPLAGGCLAGVTRALTIELSEQEGIPVSEKAVPLVALHQASEAFLTGTTREVQPIRNVDGMELPNVPGEITAKLRAAFRALADGKVDP